MKQITKVRRVANHFRAWAEKNTLYGDDLMGMCSIVSFEIFDALHLEGFNVQFCTNEQHSFVLWFDKRGTIYLIDATATQFYKWLPKVMVRRYDKLPKLSFTPWEIRGRAHTPDEVKHLLRNWFTDQKPMQFRKAA